MYSHINEEIARLFLERKDPEILKSAASIDGDAAKVLAGYRGPLDLSGLKSLTYEVADGLSGHVGKLLLNGIYRLENRVDAEALTRNKGDIHFWGLRHLSAEAAEAFLSFDWALHFDPILSKGFLTNKCRDMLVMRSSRLSMRRIKSGLPIHFNKFEIALIKQSGLRLDLPDLPVDLAKQLAGLKFRLTIAKLKTISPEAAQELSTHAWSLSLDDVVKMSDSTAIHLANHKGAISLYGMKRLSKKAAKVFSQRKQELDGFHGLTTLPLEIARKLVEENSGLWINLDNLKSLSVDVANELSRVRGRLNLSGLKKLSLAAAKAFSLHEGSLLLNGIREMTVPLSQILAKHKGDLFLNGLKEISVDVADALAEHRGGRGLWLCGLEKLTKKVAEALARHEGPLAIDGLKSISKGAALALSKFQGQLSCEGLLKRAPQFSTLLIKSEREINLFTKYAIGSHGIFPVVVKFYNGAYYYDGGHFLAGPFPSFDESVDALEGEMGTRNGGLFDQKSEANNYLNGLSDNDELLSGLLKQNSWRRPRS